MWGAQKLNMNPGLVFKVYALTMETKIDTVESPVVEHAGDGY